jgi:biotin carboxylase
MELMETTMNDRYALILLHQGSLTVAPIALACRNEGLCPVALSNASGKAAEQFMAKCSELDIECHVVAEMSLTLEHALQAIGTRVAQFALCLAVWDAQRPVMALVNHHLGVADASPIGVAAVQDKLEFRRLMLQHGLSRLRCAPAASAQAQDMISSSRGPWIVKPRRGLGSLCTRRIHTAGELHAALSEFAKGTAASDMFVEVFHDNELIVEEFFNGTEFAFEILLRDGKCIFFCEHEKDQVTFMDQTVLENAMFSPSTSLTSAQVEQALAIALQGLELCNLQWGWYHVELLIDDVGDIEFIEVNARLGGAGVAESLSRQFGFNAFEHWLQMLQGKPIHPPRIRRCGIYHQCSYARSVTPVAKLQHADQMRAPDFFRELKKSGDPCRVDREDMASIAVWETPLRSHAEELRQLSQHQYITVCHESPAADVVE